MSEYKSIISKIEDHKRITPQEAITLWSDAPLWQLGRLASKIKSEKSGNSLFYNRNFHIEPTNICLFNCRFCSYRKAVDSPQAWDYSLQQIESIAQGYADKNITEVHIVGGVHPKHDLYHYIEMIKRVKSTLPEAIIKAFTAIELAYMIDKANLSYHEGLIMLKQAGMEAMPGGGAEIFDEQIRSKICPEKGSTQIWLQMHRIAHQIGISSNATILYGHIESVQHRIDHLDRLRNLQDATGGFNAFIPLKYRNFGNSMSEIGEVSIVEDMKMLALSRIFLDNFAHIKAYWPMYGKTTTELALAFGADDIDGTIDNSTKIYSMAGAEDQNPSLTIAEIEKMAVSAGLQVVERDTFYNPIIR